MIGKEGKFLNYWLLTTEYPPLHGGGISTYCELTARLLTKKGCKVTVFVADQAVTNYTTSEGSDVTVVRFNPDRNQLQESLGYSARLSYAFADIVKEFVEGGATPDLIEAQDYLGIAYYLTQFKHLDYPFVKDVPIVITLHSPAFIYLEYNRVSTYSFPEFWTCQMEKESIKAADLLISPTKFIAGEVRKYIDLSDKTIEILPNPFEFETDDEISFARNKIIYYSKLSPQKGTFELLKYFKKLWDNGFPHALNLVGGTDIVYHPEMQTMGQLVEKFYSSYINKGLIQFQGKILPSEIKKFLKDAHVIVFPSIVDNLPYAVMEAMSIGKIVLASVQGGQREMIEDGVTGFLFDHNRPDTFEEKLNHILALPDDEIRSVSRNAQRAVKDLYNFNKIGAAKVELITRLVSRHSQENSFPFLHQEEINKPAVVNCTDNLLSVVIPYYNMGAYITEALESVINSTWKDLEVIIINDGSTDAMSVQKLAQFENIKNVKVIHQENKGLTETRNRGAAIAKGEYLAFLDADDKVDPAYYEKAIRVLKAKENVFFVGSWVQYYGNTAKFWPTFTPQPPYALVHNPVNSSGLVYKRTAFLAGGLNDNRMDFGLEDYESVINMMRHGFNGVVLPERLFHYRVRSGSMFRQVTKGKLLHANRYITDKHSAYIGKFSTPIIHLLNANGPGYLFDNPTLEVTVTSSVNAESRLAHKMKTFIKKNEQLKKVALMIKRNLAL
ncbi:glycosyltransferase [Chryseosolibacter indicus]|uniref:Glycosyltransferase n=1 Tax=Chryseosolibacter indicus TaxID=2782351 RepID=A0ABS5VUC6_9BACT|nr:glycosyltransferase [Chryseosolibacter indicus]MBT1703591.1 glycosyltransferase [Chryseosolibacter indicus]